MIRLRPLLLILVVLALPAAADTTITLTAGQTTALDRVRQELNRQTCLAVGLSAGCTQAQARATGAVRSRVWTDVADMLADVVLDFYQAKRDQVDRAERAAFCTTFLALTTNQKNARCAADGLPNGCSYGCQ